MRMNKKLYTLLLATLVLLGAVNTSVFAQDNTPVAPKPLADGDISLSPSHFNRAETDINKSVLVATIHLTSKQYDKPITLRMGGGNKNFFSVNPQSLPAGTTDAEVKISYDPLSIGVHKASLFVECESDPSAAKVIRVEGVAKDPNNPPVVTLNPTTLPEFTTTPGAKVQQKINVAPKNCPDHVKVRMANGHVFKLNTAQVFRFNPQDVAVTFAPLVAGEYKDTLIVSTYGINEQRIPLVGKASGEAPKVEAEGDKLELKTDNPLALLNETFENHARFKALKVNRWLNVAVKGSRAWWGYSFPDYERETPAEGAAYVTGYDSKIEIDQASDAEILLVSPPLDFVNAKRKVLTFRLRGDNLRDDQTEKLTVYYMELKDGKIEKYPFGGFTVPASKNEGGEWKDFHLDLSEQQLPSVFFVAFGYEASHSPLSTVKYYVDDVTWGRTDLPIIKTNTRVLEFVTTPNQPSETKTIKVETENVSKEIKVRLGGRNTKGFKVTPKTLPAEGGELSVRFTSAVEGLHEGFIRLSTRGAADQIIDLRVANTTTGVANLEVNVAENAQVFDLNGRHVLTTNNASVDALKQHLKAGVYVVKTKNKTYKVTLF